MRYDFCVRCCEKLGRVTGESSIYRSDDSHILCEPCFFDEEAEQERRGTNNLPDVLAKYDENIERMIKQAGQRQARIFKGV